MILLAIDTSGPNCAAGFYDIQSGDCLAHSSIAMERGHAEVLVGQIQQLVDENALRFSDISKVAVTTGPGSFAGLRVGLAAAKGYALAVEAELVGITTFDALRAQLRATKPEQAADAVIILDGRRGELFIQNHSGAHRIVTNELVETDLGDGLIAGPLAIAVAEQLNLKKERIHEMKHSPDLAYVAKLALQATTESNPPKLFYMRGADAKKGAGFSVERAT